VADGLVDKYHPLIDGVQPVNRIETGGSSLQQSSVVHDHPPPANQVQLRKWLLMWLLVATMVDSVRFGCAAMPNIVCCSAAALCVF
jgi:hypothetical protein